MTSNTQNGFINDVKWDNLFSKDEFLYFINNHCIYLYPCCVDYPKPHNINEIRTLLKQQQDLVHIKQKKKQNFLNEALDSFDIGQVYDFKMWCKEKFELKYPCDLCYDDENKCKFPERADENIIKNHLLIHERKILQESFVSFWNELLKDLSEEGWSCLLNNMNYEDVYSINWLIYLKKQQNQKEKEHIPISNVSLATSSWFSWLIPSSLK